MPMILPVCPGTFSRTGSSQSFQVKIVIQTFWQNTVFGNLLVWVYTARAIFVRGVPLHTAVHHGWGAECTDCSGGTWVVIYTYIYIPRPHYPSTPPPPLGDEKSSLFAASKWPTGGPLYYTQPPVMHSFHAVFLQWGYALCNMHYATCTVHNAVHYLVCLMASGGSTEHK